MELLPKILIATASGTSGLLWIFRVEARKMQLLIEPNLDAVLEKAQAEDPDLVLLDFNILDAKGLALIKALRDKDMGPVIVLINGQNTPEVLKAYEAGADDCILKPVEPALFLAKVNAWLRHTVVMPVDLLNPVRAGKVLLDPAERLLSINGYAVELTKIETRLMYLLMSQPGEPVSVEEMINLVWKDKEESSKAVLKNTIHRLRLKLEAEPAQLACIETVPGYGYKFDLSKNPELKNYWKEVDFSE